MKSNRLSHFSLLSFYILFLVHASQCLMGQAPKALDENPEFVEARSLFWSGQYDRAEKQFKSYLSENPEHAPSKDFLKMILQSRKYNPEQISLTKKFLHDTRVMELKLKDTDWRTFCAHLEKLANAAAAKNGKLASKTYMNFINLLPSQFDRKISIELQNVSLYEAVKKGARLAELRFVVDTWAVIFEMPQPRK
jgi:hypothetical protein